MRSISEADSIMAVYREDHGRGSRGGPVAILIVWPDGRLLWSSDRLKGGAPFRAGRIEAKKVATVLDRFEKDGLLGDDTLNRPLFGPDSQFITVLIRSGQKQAKMQSWHELIEEAVDMVVDHRGVSRLEGRRRLDVIRKAPADYQFFRFVWSEARSKLSELIPTESTCESGRPVVNAGVLSWYPAGEMQLPPAPAPRDKPKVFTAPPPRPASPIDEAKVIRSVLTAKDSSRAADAYQLLFRDVGTDQLARLQSHASDSIAMQAAWMQVELTVPPEWTGNAVRPDRDKLAWFLGFLEGRARVQPPKWWSEAFLDARANRRGNVYAGGLNRWADRKRGDPVEKYPEKATLKPLDGRVALRLGKESIQMPVEFLDKLQKQEGYDEARALFTPAHCYVAFHDQWGYDYRIGCVERSPLKLRWVSGVWGCFWGLGSGVSREWVEIVEQGDRVVVFGIANTGFYVEAFRADDGANVFRFSNSYSP